MPLLTTGGQFNNPGEPLMDLAKLIQAQNLQQMQGSYQQAQVGLEQQRVGLAGQTLQVQQQQAAASIASENAQTERLKLLNKYIDREKANELIKGGADADTAVAQSKYAEPMEAAKTSILKYQAEQAGIQTGVQKQLAHLQGPALEAQINKMVADTLGTYQGIESSKAQTAFAQKTLDLNKQHDIVATAMQGSPEDRMRLKQTPGVMNMPLVQAMPVAEKGMGGFVDSLLPIASSGGSDAALAGKLLLEHLTPRVAAAAEQRDTYGAMLRKPGEKSQTEIEGANLAKSLQSFKNRQQDGSTMQPSVLQPTTQPLQDQGTNSYGLSNVQQSVRMGNLDDLPSRSKDKINSALERSGISIIGSDPKSSIITSASKWLRGGNDYVYDTKTMDSLGDMYGTKGSDASAITKAMTFDPNASVTQQIAWQNYLKGILTRNLRDPTTMGMVKEDMKNVDANSIGPAHAEQLKNLILQFGG